MNVYKYLFPFVSGLVIVTGVICANEFVKKKPAARVQRKHAQQRDILIERCATMVDALITGFLSLQQQCAIATADWYDLLKDVATTDSCCLEKADLDALKEYVASLEEVTLLKQKLEQAVQACGEKHAAVLRKSA
jgi:hypothetical protein